MAVHHDAGRGCPIRWTSRWVAGAGLCLLLCNPAQSGIALQEITQVQQQFTTVNARNIGSCLALIEAGSAEPRRLLVGTAGSNAPSGMIQVGRTVPIELQPGGTWAPLFSDVTGSPSGDLNSGYFGYRCAADGTRHVVSQRGLARAHVYQDGVMEQTLVPALVSASSAQPDSAVAIGSGIAALGVPQDNGNRGRVHLWQLVGSNWQPLQVLDAGANAVVGGQFGWSVAIAGETLLVGAPAESAVGRVYVFELNGAQYQRLGTLSAPSTIDPGVTARFGHHLAVDTADLQSLFVGAPSAKLNQVSSRTGTAVAYRFDATLPVRWGLQYALPPPDPVSAVAFGSAVRLHDGVLLASDPNNAAGPSVGAVYRYRFSSDLGIVQSLQKLYRSAGGPDNFGWSVEIQGDAAVIGAPNEFILNPAFGNVYMMGGDRLLSDSFESP